jgi:hypothetical protein
MIPSSTAIFGMPTTTMAMPAALTVVSGAMPSMVTMAIPS